MREHATDDALEQVRGELVGELELDLAGVLGKGHEQGQTIGDTTTPFDDAAVLAERWRDEQQRPRAEEDEPGGAGRAATTEVRG